MSNTISEEPNTQQPGGAVDKVRKAARQLAYDVRYKVKGQFKDGQKSDAASLKRAYMQQLGKSPAPGPVKVMAKKMLVGEAYDLVDVSDTVNESVVNALLKVFAKKTQLEDADGNVAYEVTDIVQEEMKDTKYKVRVTDKSTGKTYVRMADREKIGQLRADPRISSVEMTGYGDSYDKPVGKGKGEEEKKETAKEEFIHEVNVEDDNPEANTKKIDVMKGKNKIIINPTQSEEMKPGEDASAEKTKESSVEKRIRMVKRKILQSKMQAVRQGAGADIVAHTELEGEEISEKAGCAHTHEGTECSVHGKGECPPESSSKKEKEDTDDYRSMPTKVNMVRNKLRAMGLKMSYDMKGEQIDEIMTPKEKGESEVSRSSSTLEMGRRTKDAYHKVRGAMIAAKQLKKDAEELKNEATEDSLKDRRMERGGVDGNNRYNKPVSNTPNTFGKKKPKYDGMSAIDKVKASIRAKHGQGAIIDTKKK
jgi:hypothetical protein